VFTRVADQIYMVAPTDQGSFPSSFSFYIDDTIPALIDTPLSSWLEVFKASMGNHPVKAILNTHYHRDHTGCNHLFPEAEVFAHPADIPAMVSRDAFIQYYGFDKYADQKLVDDMMSWLQWRPCPVHHELEDGQIINLGNIDLTVIHTPGHTPGHCVFYWEKQKMLFSGDIDLTSFGPWYGNVNSDITQLIDSIEKLISLNPQVICSGHKGVIDHNVRGRLQEYLDRLLEKEDCILKALKKPLTLDELVHRKLVYGRWGKPEDQFYYFEKLSVLIHLRRLIELKQVEEYQGKYWATGASPTKCAQI
jgi:glyoxylase-like metal-dependent hydrolase (beta-lactamase superfamily II)